MGMLKEISQLQIELAEYERTVAHMRDGAKAVLERAEKAEAELAALREDAERYRWLKANAADIKFSNRHVVKATMHCLDAAIDAARKEGA